MVGPGQPVRDALDRADVVGDVLTGAAVAAGGRPHQPAALVEQVDRQAVDLELAQVVEVGTAGVAGDPERPRRQLVGAEDVVEAEHALEVLDRGEVGGERRPDLLGRAVGGAQPRVGVLELVQPAEQGVVLAVADRRRVAHVVGELVRAHLLGQVGPLVPDLVGGVDQLGGGSVAHDVILPHATDTRRSPVTGPTSHRGQVSARRRVVRRRRGGRPISSAAPITTAAPSSCGHGQVLVEQQDTQGDGHHGDHVGHRRADRGAGGAHHVELQRERDAGADDAEREHREQRQQHRAARGRRVHRPGGRQPVGGRGPPQEEHHHHLGRGHRQLRGRQRETTEVAAAQEPLVVGPAQAVGGPGDQRHAEADEVGPSGGLPRLHDHEDPEEPHEHADDLAPADDVTAQEQQAEDHRGDGGGGVADTGQGRADPLLAEGEQAERQRAQEERRHQQVRPDGPVAGQPAAGGGQQRHEHGRAADDPQAGDLQRRQRAQPDLHEEEARSPDQGEGAELGRPRHAGLVWVLVRDGRRRCWRGGRRRRRAGRVGHGGQGRHRFVSSRRSR